MICKSFGTNDNAVKTGNGTIKMNKNKSDLLNSIGGVNRSKNPSLSRGSFKQLNEQVIQMNDLLKSNIGKNDKSSKKLISSHFLLSPSVKRYLRDLTRAHG